MRRFINALALILLALAVVYGIWRTRQVSTLTTDLQNSRDSTRRFQVLYLTGQKTIADIRASTGQLIAGLNNRLASVGGQIAGLTERAQRTTALKNLVASRALPAYRLRDTLYVPGPIEADSQLVAAVATSTAWLEVYKQQGDSLAQAVSASEAKVRGLEKQQQQFESDALNLESFVRDTLATGGVWPFNAKRISQHKEVAKRLRRL
jgi:uncharacterized membrane protein YccC